MGAYLQYSDDEARHYNDFISWRRLQAHEGYRWMDDKGELGDDV